MGKHEIFIKHPEKDVYAKFDKPDNATKAFLTLATAIDALLHPSVLNWTEVLRL